MRPRILFLVHADFDALQRKGVAERILDRDEGGFFERVITVHPLASRSRTFDLNATHSVAELGFAPGIWRGRLGWRELALMPFRALQAAAACIDLGRREQVDIVRATDPYFCGLLAWFAAGRLRVPFCVSVHADYAAQFALMPRTGAGRVARWVASRVRRFVLRRAALVMPISRYLARLLEAEGVDARRMRVIPHGIEIGQTPPSTATARGRFGLEGTGCVVGFVGRLSRGNYVDDVLDAVAIVRRARPDVLLLMVGAGEEEARLRLRVETERDLRGAVRFTGFVTGERARDACTASDVVLCPLSGFSLIEACAAGAAVVTYDVEWHTELVEHQITGWVAPVGDVEALAAGVERLLANPAERRVLGAAARAKTLALHDLTVTSGTKRAVYEELLRLKRAG